MKSKSPSLASDYIIVGGGLCGCVLGSRLLEANPSSRILIIEAGPDSRGHPLTSEPLRAFAAQGSDIDWGYTTTPQTHLNNGTYRTSSGKVLSGETAINAGAWIRGSAVDYDQWAEEFKIRNGAIKDCYHTFERRKTNFDKHADPKVHGFDGPIHTISVSASDPKRLYPQDQAGTSGRTPRFLIQNHRHE